MQDLEILYSLHLISEACLMLLVWKELTQFSSDLSGASCLFFLNTYSTYTKKPLQTIAVKQSQFQDNII